MQNKSKQLAKAPMSINVNSNICTTAVFTGHAATTLEALNNFCANSLLQK